MNIMEERFYKPAEINCIVLDNEISLALESSPPAGPEESSVLNSDYFNNNNLLV